MNTLQYNNADDDVTDEISSPYLKGADVPPSGLKVTIKIVSLETFPSTPNDPPKRVILFYEIKKRLVANKTQLSTLAELFGPHPSEWRSKTIMLEPMHVMFNGKPAVSIKISAAPDTVAAGAAPTVSDTDIPF